MADAAELTTRLDALLRVLADRPKIGALPPGEALDAFVIQQLDDVSAQRFNPLIDFVSAPAANDGRDAVDALAVRALLDDYAAAVRQMRTVARACSRALDDAEKALAAGTRLVEADGQ